MATRSFKRSNFNSSTPRYSSFLVGNDYYVPPAFESIATLTGNGSATSLTFNSIPGTYASLQLRAMFTMTSLDELAIRLNGDTASNYNYHGLDGNGSTVSAVGSAFTAMRVGPAQVGTHSTYMTVLIFDLHDYASTTRNKTGRSLLGMDANGSGEVDIRSGLWRSTSAVTSLTVFGSNAFTSSSQFALYGIKGA